MKKTIIFSALLVFFCFINTGAQVTFQKAYGSTSSSWNDFGRAVLRDTADMGYTIAGFTNSFGQGVGIYLFHTNANGVVLWSKQYGNLAYGQAIDQTWDYGYIIAGLMYSPPGYHYLAVRTDNNGDTLWTRVINNGISPGAASDGKMSVCQTYDGGFAFTGFYDANNCFGIIRTDANGNIKWTKSYGLNGEKSHCIIQTYDYGFILCGYTFNFGAGDYDAYLVKTDSLGNIVWTRTYGTAGVEEAFSVQQTSDNGYILTGKTQPGGILSQGYVFLIKTDVNGDTLWTRRYGGSVGEIGYSVRVPSSGGYIVTGVTYSFGAGGQDVYLLRTDNLGNVVWSKAYGGVNDEFGTSVIHDFWPGGFIVTGETSSFGSGGIDVYLIRTDENGSSGCNESDANTVTGSTMFTVSSGGGLLSSGAVAYCDSVAITLPLKTETPLCFVMNVTQPADFPEIFTVYPNPANENMVISLPGTFAEVVINIYDVTGKEVRKFSVINAVSINLNCRELCPGLYYMQFKAESNIIGVTKFVISE